LAANPFLMCMTLYLGPEKKLPIIDYNPDQPAFNTKELDDSEIPVLRHFSFPHVLYIGSHEGCGCSFRHALFDEGEWFQTVPENDLESDALAVQLDHRMLVNYLKASQLKEVEVYACWDGDYSLQKEYEAVIKLDEILNVEFFFKERGHYLIRIGS